MASHVNDNLKMILGRQYMHGCIMTCTKGEGGNFQHSL
jgi:hypothetical protein